MRLKYTLEVDVYGMRNVHRVDVPIREEKQRRAQGAMVELRRRAKQWNHQEQWEPQEWEVVEQILRLLCPEDYASQESADDFSFTEV